MCGVLTSFNSISSLKTGILFEVLILPKLLDWIQERLARSASLYSSCRFSRRVFDEGLPYFRPVASFLRLLRRCRRGGSIYTTTTAS